MSWLRPEKSTAITFSAPTGKCCNCQMVFPSCPKKECVESDCCCTPFSMHSKTEISPLQCSKYQWPALGRSNSNRASIVACFPRSEYRETCRWIDGVSSTHTTWSTKKNARRTKQIAIRTNLSVHPHSDQTKSARHLL